MSNIPLLLTSRGVAALWKLPITEAKTLVDEETRRVPTRYQLAIAMGMLAGLVISLGLADGLLGKRPGVGFVQGLHVLGVLAYTCGMALPRVLARRRIIQRADLARRADAGAAHTAALAAALAVPSHKQPGA